jgi:hypothetical protein
MMRNTRNILLLSFLCSYAYSVTIIPATFHLPRQHNNTENAVSSEYELLIQSIPSLASNGTKLSLNGMGLWGSLAGVNKTHGIHPLQDSFVRGAIDAWAQHQHFVIRPEAVWFTILTQLNFYLANHRDSIEVRDKILHQHNMYLSILSYIDVGLTTYGAVKNEMAHALKQNFTTYSFIQPNFTTSTQSDKHLANLITIGFINTTSEAHSASLCGGGMPSVTLLGTEKDWRQLLAKLDRFPEFGSQPAEYGETLRPILSRFVKSYVTPNDMELRKFWDHIVDSGVQERDCLETGDITGWINGFHHWNQYGVLLPRDSGPRRSPIVSYDGVVYPRRNMLNLPSGYTGKHVLSVRKQGCNVGFSELLGGMIGKQITKGKPSDYILALRKVNLSTPITVTDDQHSMLQPVSRWFAYTDSRFDDYGPFPGESNTSYDLRTCQSMVEGDTYVNFPSSRDIWWW